MNNLWTQRWNERYRQETYSYGTTPNVYLEEQLAKLLPGSILFPAEGEGRNGVYAATQGWKVSGFDLSEEGKKKALQLAEKHQVTLDYQVGPLEAVNYEVEQFDAIALIYAHFPAELKSMYHQTLATYLRRGGTIIFEAYGKNHLSYREKNPQAGGPNNLDMLFSTEELAADFQGFEIIELVEKEVELAEGLYHNGTASVVRFVGRKK